MPYIVRTIGAERFGLLAFATSTITYLAIIVNYGYNLSATRQVSIHRNDNEKLSEIYSSVLITRTLLLLLSFVLLTIVLYSFEKFNRDIEVYYLTFGVIIGQVLLPTWLFQGLEKMQFITLLNVSIKLIFTVMIFVFVKSESDFLLIPVLNSMGYLLVGILSILLVRQNFRIYLSWQPFSVLIEHLKEGWHIFISNISISLYSVSSTFILGIFTDNTTVGYYSGAERIIKAIRGLYGPISQSLYPFLGKLFVDSKSKARSYVKKLTIIIAPTMLIVSLFVFFLSEIIVCKFLGDSFSFTIPILRIMSFLPLIIALSNIFGIQTMLNLGYKKAYMTILTSGALLSLVLNFTLVPTFEAFGTAFTVVFTEAVITLSMFIFLTIKLK